MPAAARSESLRLSVGVFLLSRGLVLAAAAAAYLAIGAIGVDDPPLHGAASPFDGVGEWTVDIWSRWDSSWYLQIAHEGYGHDYASAAFPPLYPFLIGGVGKLTEPLGHPGATYFAAALAISWAAYVGALYLAHRLFVLEAPREAAALAVVLMALFPMGIFAGAIYTEGLFLLLAVAAFWFARNDRWALAGLSGAAATATRSAGIALVVGLAALYLLGPRGTGASARPYLGAPWRSDRGRRLYPLRADVLWICLVPLGFAFFMLATWQGTGDPRAAFDAQQHWSRGFGELGGVPLGPVAGLATGVAAAADGLVAIFSDPARNLDPTGYPKALDNVEGLIFLAAAAAATAGALRRLPLAYGAYAAATLLFILSFPTDADEAPLVSLNRYVAVIFPLFLWLALAVRERGWERPAIAVSALGLVAYSVKWGAWMWVG